MTGATGLVGSVLAEHLEKEGWGVRVVSRSAKGSDVVTWDPEEGELDPARLEGVDVVVHLAGENIAGRWTEAKKRRIRQSRVRGTRLLARTLACLEHPPEVLVSASAVGYYGDRGQALLDEGATRGAGFLSEVCAAWEASAAPAVEASIRVVHPRIGVVLTGEGGALGAMKLPFKLGVGGKVGSGEQLMSWVHIDDLVRMISFAIDRSELVGPFNAVAPKPVSNAEFTKTLGEVLERPTFLAVPDKLARVAMGEAADEMLLASTGVLPARLQSMGFEWRHPYLREALVAALG